MKKSSRIIWGIVLIAAGVLLSLKALGIADINIFFEGWWTLFIILPCAIGLVTEKSKIGNAAGLTVGVLLLLACRDIIEFDLIFKLIGPIIVVCIGLKLLFGGVFSEKIPENIMHDSVDGNSNRKDGCATFGGCDMKLDGEQFTGGELTAVFGGVKCDLRGAKIEADCAVKVNAIFGGIDIITDDHINVKLNTANIFGGSSNKTPKREGVPTLYVSGSCMFGGVDVK